MKTIKVIHSIDADRMIFIAPRLRAAPKISPASSCLRTAKTSCWRSGISSPGPLKNNGKYPWTSGTAAEKAAIHNRIATALRWQQNRTRQLGRGWGVGSQTALHPPRRKWPLPRLWPASCKRRKYPTRLTPISSFMTERRGRRPAPEPLLEAMIAPACEKPGEKPGHHALNRLLVVGNTRRQRQPAQQNQ